MSCSGKPACPEAFGEVLRHRRHLAEAFGSAERDDLLEDLARLLANVLRRGCGQRLCTKESEDEQESCHGASRGCERPHHFTSDRVMLRATRRATGGWRGWRRRLEVRSRRSDSEARVGPDSEGSVCVYFLASASSLQSPASSRARAARDRSTRFGARANGGGGILCASRSRRPS